MNVVRWLKEHGRPETNPFSKIQKMPCSDDGKSFIYLTIPFDGVFCWANDVYCTEIPTDYDEKFNGMSFNFCTDGGCEVSLYNGNYVYVRKNILSIDTSATKTSHFYPTSRYRGLEIIFDFDAFNSDEVTAIGFNPSDFLDSLAARSIHGSFLTIPSGLWQRKAAELTEHLLQQDISMTELRFYLLELLFLIQKEGAELKPASVGFLSKGQRAIASEVGNTVSQNLAEHYKIEDFAEKYKISPSSLKQYFTKLYGLPFSVYLHQLRMEKSAALIAEGVLSIGEIAEKVGYKNQSKFGSAFKKYFGKPPLEYRRLSSVEAGAEK